MKKDENDTFRPGKTREDRMPVGARPRVERAQRRRELPSHERTAERMREKAMVADDE